MNAAPTLLLLGILLVVCFVDRDKFWEYPRYEQVQTYAYGVFIIAVWGSIELVDKWLVQAWQRRREGKKAHAHRDDEERPVPLE